MGYSPLEQQLRNAIGYNISLSIDGHPEIRNGFRTVEDADGLVERILPLLEENGAWADPEPYLISEVPERYSAEEYRSWDDDSTAANLAMFKPRTREQYEEELRQRADQADLKLKAIRKALSDLEGQIPYGADDVSAYWSEGFDALSAIENVLVGSPDKDGNPTP